MQVENFCSKVNYLFEKHVPIKTVKVIKNNCPWFSKEIENLIAEREYLYMKYRQSKSLLVRELYKKTRNKVTFLMRRAKKNYYANLLRCDLPPKKLWSNLKRSGICGKEVAHCGFDADALNKYFCSLECSNLSSTMTHVRNSAVLSSEGFSFHGVETADVAKAIMSIKSNATGPDNLPPKFLKLILPYVVNIVRHIFNTCLMSSQFPEVWKIAEVIPIAKVSCPKSTSDFRPISLICFLSKAFEKIIFWQIQEHLCNKKLLCEYQSGFRKNYSCESALLRVTTDLLTDLDQDNLSILSLLDFSKAFNMVDHEILLQKLSRLFVFSSSACSLVMNIIKSRSQYTKVDGKLSSSLRLSRGVPQGSILGPLLFSMFINDLPTVIRESKYHLYADDVQLYLSRPVGLIEDCAYRLNENLQRITNWAMQNKLLLNASKTVCMIVYSKDIPLNELPPIFIDDQPLKYVNCVRNLGVYTNNKMTCCDHVSACLKKIYGGLRRLKLSTDLLSPELKVKLVKSLLLPHFSYGSIVFPYIDAVCLRKLRVALNDCVRFVYGISRSAHVSPYFNNVFDAPLEIFLKTRVLLFLHKLIYSNGPQYLRDELIFLQSNRNANLLIPRFRTKWGERSYFVQASRYWNALSPDVQRLGSFKAFKKQLLSL